MVQVACCVTNSAARPPQKQFDRPNDAVRGKYSNERLTTQRRRRDKVTLSQRRKSAAAPGQRYRLITLFTAIYG